MKLYFSDSMPVDVLADFDTTNAITMFGTTHTADGFASMAIHVDGDLDDVFQAWLDDEIHDGNITLFVEADQ